MLILLFEIAYPQIACAINQTLFYTKMEKYKLYSDTAVFELGGRFHAGRWPVLTLVDGNEMHVKNIRVNE